MRELSNSLPFTLVKDEIQPGKRRGSENKNSTKTTEIMRAKREIKEEKAQEKKKIKKNKVR